MTFNTSKLKEHIIQVRGISYKPNQISKKKRDGYLPLLKANNITENGLDASNLIYIDKAIVKKKQLIREGDILLAASSGSKKVIGKNIYFSNDTEYTFGAFCKVVRPKTTVFKEYLKHFFKTNYYRRAIISQVQGANINNLKTRDIDDLIVPLLSLPNQKHIAKVLSHCEDLIAKRKESIDLLDEFVKSTFLEMFGDPAFNPLGWTKKKLGMYVESIVDIGSNGSNAMVAKNLQMTDNEDYAIMIRTTNLNKNNFTENLKYITKETYELFSKSKVYGGEIIMNKIGSAGNFWIMPNLSKPVSLGLNQFRIKLKDLKTNYLYYFLSTNYGKVNIKKRTKGTTTKSITKSAVRDLPLLIPPIELQDKFDNLVKKVEVVKSQYKNSLLELEQLYGSLSQQFFNKTKTKKNREKKEPTLTKEKLIWEDISVEKMGNLIKEKYSKYHFNIEMLFRFFEEEQGIFPHYYSSKLLKEEPNLNYKEDIKSFVFSAIEDSNGQFNNPFIKLKQLFYNAEEENLNLSLTEEDYELIQSRGKSERSGIYFEIV